MDVAGAAAGVRTPAEFSSHVQARADSEARMYLLGREQDNPVVSEMKDLIEGVISPEYSGRTVLELLQNGHDAHDRTREDGQLQVLLDAAEGPYGTLYAVNGGAPLDDRNFKRITGTGRSTKRPDNSIGNKGIGFKSVNELSAAPEVYSASMEGSPGLTGYRFRFATPADFDAIARRVAPNEAGLADELREKVSHLRVPVPLDQSLPARVEQFAAESVSTVIRLPLRSPEALDSARSQIREIESSEVPFHLFLDRVSVISLETIGPEGARETVLIRDQAAVPWADRLSAYDVVVRELLLGDDRRYIVASHDIPGTVFRQAIEDSCSAGQLNRNWLDWEGPARVSVAFPMHDGLEAGRLYTFLPMGPQAQAPLPAFVNAPFASRADRRTLSESVSVNAVLLEAVAKISAGLLAAGAADGAPIPAELLVDAASWTESPDHLDDALKAHDLSLWQIPFIPAIGDPPGRAGLDTAYHWDFQGREFNPDAVAATAAAEIIDPGLSEPRVRHLRKLCEAHEWTLEPPPEVLAVCIEAVARHLATSSAVADRWADFYDDLARLDLKPAVLAGRAILLDESGELARAGRVLDAPQVYFPPRQADDSAGSLSLPVSLRARLLFASSKVPDRGEGRSAALRPGREWLARQGLVSEYRTENILSAVASTMKELSAKASAHDADLRECLTFAFELTRRAVREIKDEALQSLELFVPVASGWVRAPVARFDEGWVGPDAYLDAALSGLVSRVAADQSSSLAELAGFLVSEPARGFPEIDAEDHEQLRIFLESLGVRHGLWPVDGPRPRQRKGDELKNPRLSWIDGDLPLAGFTKDDWRSLAGQWPGRSPWWTTTSYAPQSNWMALPGQADYENLDEDSQRTYSELVVLGLGRWPSEALEVRFTRLTDTRGAAWPTPLAAFLSATAWVPQATPGDRSTITRSKPGGSWWLAEADTVDFLPSQPARFRVVDTDLFLHRVRLLGVRIWDDPVSARQRIDHLAGLVSEGGLAARTALSVRRAVETAWRDLVNGPAVVDLPDSLVVQAQGALTVASAPSQSATPIYVVDVDDVRQERLLEASPLSVLPIKDFRLGKKVLEHLSRGAANVRSISDLRMSVLLDGVAVEVARRLPLLPERGGWLSTLVVATMELKYRSFPPLPPNAVAAALDRLEHAQLAIGRNITVSIDDHIVPMSGPTSLVIADDATEVIVVGGAGDDDQWHVLDTAADSIAQLIGVPSLGDTLRVALTTLATTGLHDDPAEDVARALRVDPSEVRAVLHLRHTGLDTSATVFVLMCLDPAVGYELREVEGLLTDASLRQWLADRLDDGEVQADRVMQLSKETDRGRLLTLLDADLRTVNRHLRAAQLAPLENTGAQNHQYRAFLQENGARLRDQLRDRFVITVRQGADLSGYVQLGNEISSIAPDPTWVTDLWTLDRDLMARHVTAWLDARTPAEPAEPTGLPSVDQTRADAQRRLRAVLGRLPALIEAWTHKNAARPTVRSVDAPEIVEAITTTGRLDFGPLDAVEVVDLLRQSDRWPADMPARIMAAELGITGSDLEEARERIKAREAAARRAMTAVTYKDETFTADHDQMLRLFEEVRASSLDEVIATAPVPFALAITPTDTPVPRSRRARSTSWQASGPSEDKTKLIGLIGETLVGRWIEEQFGLAPTDTWMSGYRQSVYMDGIGNDSLGYDYRVETSERTLLLEVKASVGNDAQIQLGESEVRKAQDLTPDEDYMIVFVANVSDPTQARIYPLPNPFAPGGLQRYRVAGHSMTLRFDLDS